MTGWKIPHVQQEMHFLSLHMVDFPAIVMLVNSGGGQLCIHQSGQMKSRPQTRVLGPQMVVKSKGKSLISEKFKLVKYSGQIIATSHDLTPKGS